MTDEKGQFTARVLPGNVRQHVIATPGKFELAQQNSQAVIAVPADVETFELPPVELEAKPK